MESLLLQFLAFALGVAVLVVCVWFIAARNDDGTTFREKAHVIFLAVKETDKEAAERVSSALKAHASTSIYQIRYDIVLIVASEALDLTPADRYNGACDVVVLVNDNDLTRAELGDACTVLPDSTASILVSNTCTAISTSMDRLPNDQIIWKLDHNVSDTQFLTAELYTKLTLRENDYAITFGRATENV